MIEPLRRSIIGPEEDDGRADPGARARVGRAALRTAGVLDRRHDVTSVTGAVQPRGLHAPPLRVSIVAQA